ncbi:MAG: HPr family phosphocarrier protein [Sellimonas intestinalis]
MKEFTYVITDPRRNPCKDRQGLLVKAAAGFKSDIKIEKDGKAANAKTIFGVMGLGVKKDMEIKVTADGEDEAEAVEALQKFFNENL